MIEAVANLLASSRVETLLAIVMTPDGTYNQFYTESQGINNEHCQDLSKC